MFDALLHRRIDTEGLSFDLQLMDIEELNRAARRDEAQITKASYSILPLIREQYAVLNSGSALGRGNGPLLVSRRRICPDELTREVRIAIPGRHTTANLLLDRLFPALEQKCTYLFSDIAEAVMDGEADAGVLIHEGRFTYREKGLQLVADLGAEWERRCNLPLPLGMIAVSRELPGEIQAAVDRVLRRSVAHALAHPQDSYPFVRAHARELSDDVLWSHIQLFVNDFSLDLGDEGRWAIHELLGSAIPESEFFDLFVR
jgi:1,4-dihydroxy-6-naphthoate synthase